MILLFRIDFSPCPLSPSSREKAIAAELRLLVVGRWLRGSEYDWQFYNISISARINEPIIIT